MDREEVLEDAKREVDELLEMYREWSELNDKINELEDQVFAKAIEEASEHGVPVDEVIEQERGQIKELQEKASELEEEKTSVGKSMKFKNPVVWMMYKHKAYKGTNNEMRTMKDLREHCEVPDGICTKRYIFTKEFCEENLDWNIDKDEDFDPETPLEEVYTDERVIDLVQNEEFMEKWEGHEFNAEGGKPAKWREFRSDSDLVSS